MTKRRGGWWWIDRWRSSSAYTDMSLAEQGAYRNLLDELWLRDGVLPNDERILAKICGDALSWAQVREKVLARFEVTADGLRHSTHDEVAARSVEFEEQQRAKGKARAEKAPRDPAGRFQPSQPDTQPEAPAEIQLPYSVLRTPYPFQEQGNGPPTAARANPLAPPRPDLEAEALRLVREIAQRDDRDPTEVIGEAAEYRGERGNMNPAAMSEPRLLNTVLELRRMWARKPKPSANPKARERLDGLNALIRGGLKRDGGSLDHGDERALGPAGAGSGSDRAGGDRRDLPEAPGLPDRSAVVVRRE